MAAPQAPPLRIRVDPIDLTIPPTDPLYRITAVLLAIRDELTKHPTGRLLIEYGPDNVEVSQQYTSKTRRAFRF